MDQLKVVWKYRFWVFVPVAVLVPFIGYGAIGRIAENVQQRESEIQSLYNQLNSQSDLRNPQWVREVDRLREELNAQVSEAWRILYERQKDFFVWPKYKGPEGEYDFAVEIGAHDPADTSTVVPVQVLNAYRRVYPQMMREIWLLAEPRQARDSKQLVDFPPGLILDPKLPFYWDFGSRTPTLQEIFLAQEDAWYVKSLVLAIREVNKGAKEWKESPIKAVLAFDIGPSAVDESFQASGKQLQSRELEAQLSGGTTSTTSSSKTTGYYAQKTEQFVTVPVYLRVLVDQRKLWDVLAGLSNAPMPVEIKQVELLARPQRPPEEREVVRGQTAGTTQITGRREDEYYHMVQVDIWGELYRYLPPPGYEEEAGSGNGNGDSAAVPGGGSGVRL